jgi:hypothetical protein
LRFLLQVIDLVEIFWINSSYREKTGDPTYDKPLLLNGGVSIDFDFPGFGFAVFVRRAGIACGLRIAK